MAKKSATVLPGQKSPKLPYPPPRTKVIVLRLPKDKRQ